MISLERAAKIYGEMDRIFTEGNSEYLSETSIYKNHPICTLMENLNVKSKLFQNSYNDGTYFIKSLKIDDIEVIGYKEIKSTYSYYNRKEFYVDIEKICELANPAPFGKGSQTVYDENIRKALEIKAERISIESDNSTYFNYFNNIIPKNKKFVFKLYKMQIYEVGGKFEKHKDTIHSPNHYATCVVNIPTKFKGGELILYNSDNSILYECKFGYSSGSILFLTDIDHEVKEVKEGIRIVLQYDVYIEDKEEQENEDKDEDVEEDEDVEDVEEYDSECIYDKYHHEYLCLEKYIEDINENISEKLLKEVQNFMSKYPNDEFCFLLTHNYPLSTSHEILKGGDLKLYEILSNLYDVKLGYIINTFRSNYDGCYDIEEKVKLKVMNYTNLTRFINFLNGIEEKDEKKELKEKIKVHTFTIGGSFNSVKAIDYIEHTGNEAAPGEYSYVSFVLCCGKKL